MLGKFAFTKRNTISSIENSRISMFKLFYGKFSSPHETHSILKIKVLKHKACTVNNSRTGLHGLCATGLNERWSKGHRAERLSRTTVCLLLKEQHLWPLCTTSHGIVWADLNSFYKSYCIQKTYFLPFFPLWKMLLAITSHLQHSAAV